MKEHDESIAYVQKYLVSYSLDDSEDPALAATGTIKVQVPRQLQLLIMDYF